MTAAVTIGPAQPRRHVRCVLAALSAIGLAALAWAAFVRPPPRWVYNASDSVPIGWYRVQPLGAPPSLPVGSIVLTHLPADAAALAAQRGYLPAGIPLLKRVGAVAPQYVCVFNALVWIDGVPLAAVRSADRLGRVLPIWRQCRQLQPGELFLLSATLPASFDSRYFGPVHASSLIGVAHPLWREKRP
ncbi:S26 family signal peptidase [Delftia lacustris]|uniref:S26 family signal peptidase n=1 Tax=Delftia lacustris TaxID=558537 RepID=UPI0035A6E19F